MTSPASSPRAEQATERLAQARVREQVRQLYTQGKTSNATVLVVGLVFWLLIGARVDSSLLDLWLVVLTGTSIIRVAMLVAYLRAPDARPLTWWRRGYMLTTGLVGVGWSLLYLLLAVTDDTLVVVALFMMLFGVVASAVSVLGSHFASFLLYSYPQLLVAIAVLLIESGPGQRWLAVAVFVYLAISTMFVVNSNRLLMRMIRFQVENEALIERLGGEAARREQLVQERTSELRDKNRALVQEIDQRQRIEAALRESQQRFQLAMAGANDGLFDWDLTRGTAYYSPRWKSMLGYEEHEVPAIPQAWSSLLDAADRVRGLQLMDDYIRGHRDEFQVELRMRHKRGHAVDVLARALLSRDADGRAVRVVGTHVDISARKRQEQRILHQANYDSLTDLPNRKSALDRLSNSIHLASGQGAAERKQTSVSVLFLDLDEFKRINDTLGHETGDRLLIQASQRLRAAMPPSCRESLFRLGGDEFLVILDDAQDSTESQDVAEHLTTAFRDPFAIGGHELVVTLSIGIARFPQDGTTATELLRKADSAMYHAKALGRNSYRLYTEDLSKAAARRLLLEEQLHGALARHELSVLYQPIVRLSDRAIIGAEALLRWRNVTLGAVTPDEFIPIAEQTGSIVPIGNFVLQQAIGNAAKWQLLSPDFKIAVNLSPRQFRNEALARDIAGMLEKAKLLPQCLELEITEGVLLSGSTYVKEAMRAHSDLGISLSMDDFGTGYSSLSYLRHYPFDMLKIDRSFVGDLHQDRADRELVNAAILMAHGMGLKVIAEGIEQEMQLQYLRERGCDYGQGYLFSPPVPPARLTEMLYEADGKSVATG